MSKMRIIDQPKKDTYELGFGYHSDLEVYMDLSSDIPKLYAIGFGTQRIKRTEEVC